MAHLGVWVGVFESVSPRLVPTQRGPDDAVSGCASLIGRINYGGQQAGQGVVEVFGA
jgi:hypothetical protein